MPTISVDKAALFKELGRDYTTEEFDELCFEYGLELDEDTTDSVRPIVNGKQEPPQLKIEIGANRYDMLCIEGIAMMLNVFLGRRPVPNYRTIAPPSGEVQTLTVSKDTLRIRPYISGAILRNLTLDQARYDSLIALQDKLHQNLARQRTLVAIGTHDLDTVKGPFTYEALPPDQIEFAPLNQTKKMTGAEMMKFYEKDPHIGRYLHIIKDSPVFPIIYDSNRVVCSMPPIINGDHTKISPKTRNILVDVTGTDKLKVEIVVNMIVTMFSQYCAEEFTVEPINIVSEHNGETRQAPDLTPRETTAEISYINSCCGLDMSGAEISKILQRMCFKASPSKSSKDLIDVSVPPTRADVLHQADIMEDVAIAYGFNKLPRSVPLNSYTVANALPVSKLTDILRDASANAGWVEVLPLILCSHDECYKWMNRKDDGKSAVTLANPKSIEYQIVRTSLLPGLLKCLRENKHRPLPMQIFEASDVVFKDLSVERKTRSERHFAAAYTSKTSGFEVVHGLLDRIMVVLKCTFVDSVDHLSKIADDVDAYWIEKAEDPTFFAGLSASIHVRIGGTKKVIGIFGILHPQVLENFEIRYPVSALEFNADVFL